MSEIYQLMQSSTFWFSTVVMAFLISLLASYARDWIDELKAKISSKWRLKKQTDTAAFEKQVNNLKSDNRLYIAFLAEVSFQKTRHILYYIVTYAALFFAIHNYSSGNENAAVAFAVVGLATFVFPCQSINIKISRATRVINSVLGSDDKKKLFKH
ncbi:hypothetical protein M445_21855 [Vibrio owensii 47666-1]|nr:MULTISPECIES: hypothetical protein [Vibrio harveyi group]KIF45447.1 hypothetical protein M445_21855 [Vibrio owensii 47666-1]MBS9926262.1 hypothetical protein [Vibrio alginolyticus]